MFVGLWITQPAMKSMFCVAHLAFLYVIPLNKCCRLVEWPCCDYPSSSSSRSSSSFPILLPLQSWMPLQVLMEAALALSRGVPRAYLLPSPHQRQPDAQLTFKPQITHKSKVAPPPFASCVCSPLVKMAIDCTSVGKKSVSPEPSVIPFGAVLQI